MKRFSILAVLSLTLFTSCAATLTVRATAPTLENFGTCISPITQTRTGATVMHFAWTGPSAGEDSVSTTAGTLVTFTRQVPAGLYDIRAWASDAGGAGCDTTISRRFGGPPHRPSDTR